MRIESIETSKINPAKYNPRKDLRPGDPEYEKLKRSIQEFDIVEPLVWNEHTGNLVSGHQRLKILEELGHTEADVSVVDMDEQREKALNIALNKISGDWDMPKLKDLLEGLDDGMFDMDLTGFDMAEIEDLMTQFHVEDYADLDDLNNSMSGEEDASIRIVVPAKHEAAVKEWLSMGEGTTAPEIGRGVLKRCGLL